MTDERDAWLEEARRKFQEEDSDVEQYPLEADKHFGQRMYIHGKVTFEQIGNFFKRIFGGR